MVLLVGGCNSFFHWCSSRRYFWENRNPNGGLVRFVKSIRMWSTFICYFLWTDAHFYWNMSQPAPRCCLCILNYPWGPPAAERCNALFLSRNVLYSDSRILTPVHYGEGEGVLKNPIQSTFRFWTGYMVFFKYQRFDFRIVFSMGLQWDRDILALRLNLRNFMKFHVRYSEKHENSRFSNFRQVFDFGFSGSRIFFQENVYFSRKKMRKVQSHRFER